MWSGDGPCASEPAGDPGTVNGLEASSSGGRSARRAKLSFPADRFFSRKSYNMLTASWFRRSTTGSSTRSRRLRSRPALARRAVLPHLEGLENRNLLSTFPVTSLADSGGGSLREGIISGDSTIVFAPGLHGTIKLTSGDMQITKSVTIDGPGANTLSISGNDSSRIFDISGSANVAISGLAITDGLATSGGGILVEGTAALRISNCTFTGNEALGNAAGGGFGGGIEDSSPGVLSVTNSTFNTNKAIAVGPNDPIVSPEYIFASGGAIDLNLAGTGSATISNSTFIGNEALGGSPGASAGGGALSNSSDAGATLTVTNCTLTGNAAMGAPGGDGTTNYGSGQGGGINSIGALTVRNSTLTDNLAQGAPLAANVPPSQSVLSNSATAGGGIFCLDLAGGSVLIADSTLTGNQAVGGSGPAPALAEGGGISLVLVPSGLVTGCTVVNNVARGGAGGAGVAGADGVSGGIDLAGGSVVTVSNTTVNNNQAIGGAGGAGANGGAGVGGGINVGTGFFLFGAPDNCSLTLNNCTLNTNEAIGGAGGSGASGGDAWGGGLSVLTSSATLTNCTVNANQANGTNAFGGGIYALTSTVDVDNSTVNGNQANGSVDGEGGGIYAFDTTLTLMNTNVKGNKATTAYNDIFNGP